MYEFDVMPVSRVVWKLKTDLDRKIFDEIRRDCWLSELKTVSEGYRKCATTHLRSESVKEDLEFLESLDLYFLPIRKCRRVQGFAHRFYDPKPNEPYDVYGVVSRDLRYAREFKRASQPPIDNSVIGRLLGYPKCCIKFFNEVWYRSYDPIWVIAERTRGRLKKGNEIYIKDFYPEANILLRYFGVRAVPHLVCSFRCKKSKQFSRNFLQFVKHKKILMEILSSPMIWDCYKGVAIVTTNWFVGIANSMPYAQKRKVYLGERI